MLRTSRNLNENSNGRGVNQFNLNEEKQNLYNDKSHFNDADLFINHELKNGPNIDKQKILHLIDLKMYCMSHANSEEP
jgi:hypothetical protein